MTATVTFQLHTDSVWGELFYLSGNVASLGGWEKDKAIELTCSDNKETDGYIWSAKGVEIPILELIDYKFFKVSNHHSGIAWEETGNRSLFLPNPVHFDIIDYYGASERQVVRMQSSDRPRLIFLGTSHTGIPSPACTIYERSEGHAGCAVCSSKQPRLLASLLLQSSPQPDAYCVLVDVPRTFAEATARYFPKYNLLAVDAVLLSSDQPSSFLGLADLAQVPRRPQAPVPPSDFRQSVRRIVELASDRGADVTLEIGPAEPPLPLPPTELHCSPQLARLLPSLFPALAQDLTVRSFTPAPATSWFHVGPDLLVKSFSLAGPGNPVGFLFKFPNYVYGTEKTTVICYCPHVPTFSSETAEFLIAEAPSVFILECGPPGPTLPPGLQHALHVIRRVGTKRNFLTGLSHHYDHVTSNQELAKLPWDLFGTVQLASDGFEVYF